ncbi:MAG: Trk K+ transport system NAD-binding subunit [Natronomonas sp.]|jgi:Trk K+ transport system NAD-binding subunit
MSKVVIVGSDPDNVTEALEERGADVAHADGTANRPALEEAGTESCA